VSTHIDWDHAAIDDLLNSVDGPVGQMVAELSAQAAAVARTVVPVRDGSVRDRRRRAGRTSNARPPGFTKASIHVHGPLRGSLGGVYGGVNAAADPTVFLEYPAEQMDRSYPFLTTGLESLAGELL
jgi:hypothetical protein